MQDHVLVSLVGMSPGAMLAPILAWKAKAGSALKQVVLIAPGEVAARAARPIHAQWDDGDGTTLTVREVDREELLAGRFPLVEALNSIAGEGLRVGYLAAPGLNTGVAQVYRALVATGRLDEVLYGEPGGPLWSLFHEHHSTPYCNVADLGLERLSRVLGLPGRFEQLDTVLAGTLTDALGDAAEPIVRASLSARRLVLPDGLTVDWVAERGGILLLLLVLQADTEATGILAKQRLHRVVELVRRYDRAQLRLLAVVSGGEWGGTEHASDVILVHSSDDVGEQRQRVNRWLQTSTATRRALGVTPMSLQSGAGPSGSQGTLALFLGPDPSATLVSLYTHQPGHAIVLYDQWSAQVRARARRLNDMAGSLPIGKLTLVPSDRWGRGTRAVLEAAGVTSVDITPGSKAQTIALLRGIGGMTPVPTVWTLAAGRGQAWSLNTGLDGLDGRTLLGPPVAVLTGTMHSEMPVVNEQAVDDRALNGASEILGAYIVSQRKRHPEKDVRLPKSEATLRSGCGLVTRHGDERYEVQLSGWAVSTMLPGRPPAKDWGRLFELVVAHRLSQSLVFEEVLGNIKEPRELDAVARFGFHVFAFEVGSGEINDAKIAKHVDKAYVQLGRFAIPVVVAPAFGEESSGLRRRHPTCRFWSLGTLEKRSLLRGAVDDALASRRAIISLEVEDGEPEPDTDEDLTPG